jgi:hypothetical protein
MISILASRFPGDAPFLATQDLIDQHWLERYDGFMPLDFLAADPVYCVVYFHLSWLPHARQAAQGRADHPKAVHC